MDTSTSATPIETKTSITSDDLCQIECHHNINCQYFTYKVASKECLLRSSDTGRMIEIGSTSGRRYCEPCLEDHVDYFGNDISAHDWHTLASCQELCQQTSNCVAFSFLLFYQNRCHLKHAITKQSDPRATISGPKNCP